MPAAGCFVSLSTIFSIEPETLEEDATDMHVWFNRIQPSNKITKNKCSSSPQAKNGIDRTNR